MKTFKQHGSKIVKVTLVFLGATVLLLWGWNSAVPDLFSLPVMQFKQALGLMIVLGIMSLFIGKGRRSRGHATDTPRIPDSAAGE